MSKDKVATQSTTFPPPPNDADKNIAGNAVDRDITTCMSTELIGPNSPDQTVWWKVDLGGVYNIINCFGSIAKCNTFTVIIFFNIAGLKNNTP